MGEAMETNAEFYRYAHVRLPDMAQKTDRHYARYWFESPCESHANSWFGSAAEVLNLEMRNGADLRQVRAVFVFIERAFVSGSPEVKNCIDVSFVENLFWEVPPSLLGQYWRVLPPVLRKLYLDFHGHAPV
jgi:hypothetical protein